MNCLNCGSETSGSYCQNCGQKTSTSRFSPKDIFKNDIASKYYSFFKNGPFYTVKELATRPGHSIREYIEGKRVRHMNYMTLFILLSGIGVFLDKYSKVSEASLNADKDTNVKILTDYFNFMRDNPKTIIFITIPIISLFTYLLLKKSKYNFAEHLILNIYKASGLLIITKITALFSLITSNIEFLKAVKTITDVGQFAYSFWFLYQFFYDIKIYSKANIIIRVTASILFGIAFSSITMAIYWMVLFIMGNGKTS
ncbi:conserved membrane hypothetical protein [Flavobacterium sp. 9R]|uniref:DUF3667 domain-containing protein n=1 Tax=Flavobacterium sp. 9R TaxID=2653143 RepID=UPI0012F182A5|nr:DUF3667 domain-containing protein [Flavobacterium sp. 9R]VXB17345.1 conserved membrane hypothetical protein [Flavobacterium sp. 9R]